MQNPSRIKADLLLMLVALVWGTAFLGQSMAGDAGVAFLHNGFSFLLGGLLLLPWAWKRLRLTNGQGWWMLIAGGVLFGGSAFQQVGLYYTKVANAGFLTCLNVVFTPFLLWIGFRERPLRIDLLATATALLGAFLLSTNGEGLVWQVGDFLEIVGALFWAFHLVLVAKFAGKYSALSFACGQFLVCGVFNLAAGFLAAEPLSAMAEVPVLGGTLYRALLSIGFGYTMQVWLQRFTPPVDAALIFSLESVFAAFSAWVILGEGLGPMQIAGCFLIMLAASLPQVSKVWRNSPMADIEAIDSNVT